MRGEGWARASARTDRGAASVFPRHRHARRTSEKPKRRDARARAPERRGETARGACASRRVETIAKRVDERVGDSENVAPSPREVAMCVGKPNGRPYRLVALVLLVSKQFLLRYQRTLISARARTSPIGRDIWGRERRGVPGPKHRARRRGRPARSAATPFEMISRQLARCGRAAAAEVRPRPRAVIASNPSWRANERTVLLAARRSRV